MNINLSGRLDGTSIESSLKMSLHSRGQTSTSFSVQISTNLLSSYGYIGGEALYGDIKMSSSHSSTYTKTVTVKSKSASWRGTTVHKLYGYVNVPMTYAGSVKFTVKYTLRHPKSGQSISKSGTITISSSATKPDAPSSVSIVCDGSNKFAGYKEVITVTWSSSSRADKYHVERLENGEWKNRGYNSGLSYTDRYGTENKAGDDVCYRVSAVNSAGESGFKQGNVLKVRGVDFKTENGWKKCSPWIKVDNNWVRAKCIWIKVGNTWRKGF